MFVAGIIAIGDFRLLGFPGKGCIGQKSCRQYDDATAQCCKKSPHGGKMPAEKFMNDEWEKGVLHFWCLERPLSKNGGR